MAGEVELADLIPKPTRAAEAIEDAQDNTGSSSSRDAMLLWLLLVPSFVEKIAERMIIPVLPIFAQEKLHASPTVIGTVYACPALGKLLCNVPCGGLVSLFYDSAKKNNKSDHSQSLVPVLLSCLILITSYIGQGLASTTAELMVARLWEGAGLSMWVLARQTLVNELVNKQTRGRYMSTLGGIARMASIVGPYVGGFLASTSLRWPFWAQAILSAANALLLVGILLWLRDGDTSEAQNEYSSTVHPKGNSLPKEKLSASMTWFDLVSHFGPSLAALAFFCFCTAVARETRHLLFPLEAMEMGYNAHAIGLMTSVTFLVDSAMFPVAGYLMDHYGRKYSGVPALLIMGLSAASVPVLTNRYPTSIVALTIASAGCGMGNGLSSGLIMSLGGDISPSGGQDRAKFLALYRSFADSGLLLGPWVSGTLADLFSVNVGFQVLAGVALVGAFWMAFVIPETHAPEMDAQRRSSSLSIEMVTYSS